MQTAVNVLWLGSEPCPWSELRHSIRLTTGPLELRVLPITSAAEALKRLGGAEAALVVLSSPAEPVLELLGSLQSGRAGLRLLALAVDPGEPWVDQALALGVDEVLYREGLDAEGWRRLVGAVVERSAAVLLLGGGPPAAGDWARQCVEHSADGILVVDAQGTIRYANPAAAVLLGREQGRLVGSAFGHPLVAGDTADLTVPRRGEPATVEMRALRLEETPQELFLVSLRDVTRGRSTRRELEEERNRLRTLLDALPDPIYMKDSESRLIMTNRANLDFLGVERFEQVMGKTDFELYPPEQARGFHADEQQAFMTAKPVMNREELVTKRDGEPRWLLTTKVPLFSPEGEPVGTIGIGRDITERKRSEETVAHLARFPAEDPLPVLRVDQHGMVLYANPASRQVLAHWKTRVGGLLPLEWREALAAALGSGTKQEREEQVGEAVMAFVLAPVPDQGYVNIYGHDVTEHRNLERQLRIAQKMEAVGRLAGGLAHDFNNLLTVVLGYGGSLRKNLEEGSRGRNELEQILKAGERAAAIAAQLLSVGRQQALRVETLELNEVVRDAERMLRRLIGEDVELRTRLDPKLGLVAADRGQLEQVLLNLAVNARDAMPAGGILSLETSNVELDQEYCRLHVDTVPGAYVLVQVSDTGVGMDAATQERIFEPFFTTKEPGKGTGLGLPTVYGIVKQSGGGIWVYSEPGQGSTFRIYLPRSTEPLRAVPEAAPVAPRPPRGQETVLVVEDEAMVRELVEAMLIEQGYRVIAAASGGEALQRIEGLQEPVDVLVTDMVMPKMSGPTLAEALRKKLPGLRVLFMSGYANGLVVERGALRRGQAFIQKPFRSDEFLLKVREVLGGRGEQAP